MLWITGVIVLNSPNGYYTELDSTAFNRLPWKWNAVTLTFEMGYPRGNT